MSTAVEKVTWHFEAPVSVNVSEQVTITWEPNTFNTVNFGNFTCSIWLLRQDAFTDDIVTEYAPVLLSGEQNVYNNTLLWVPGEGDIDVDVPHAGTHQLAWQRTEDNPTFNVSTTFNGFSKGFNIFPLNFTTTTSASASSTTTSSSSSSSSSTTLSSSTTSAHSTITAPPSTPSSSMVTLTQSSSSSGVSKGTAIGLGVGIGAAVLIFIVAGVWWYASRYGKKKALAENRLDGRLPTPPPYKEELDGNATQVWRTPQSPAAGNSYGSSRVEADAGDSWAGSRADGEAVRHEML